jgi:hypothetical protein
MEARTPNPMGIAEGVPPPRQGEEEADDDDVDDPEYVPSKPASVPGTVTSSAMTIFTSLPSNSPEPEEWEIEYGFRFRGGWKTAPWQGRVDESIPVERGRGKVWVCPIDGLEADSKYIVRVRARAPAGNFFSGAGVVGWGGWSETSSVIATLADASATAADGTAPAASALFSVAGAFIQESISSADDILPGKTKEVAEAEAEPPPEAEAEAEAEPEPEPPARTKSDAAGQARAHARVDPRWIAAPSPPRGPAWVRRTGPVPTWPQRFVEVAYSRGTTEAKMGVHVYEKEDGARQDEYSIADLGGCAIKKGVESWVGLGDFPKITLSGGSLADRDTTSLSFAFSDEARCNRFSDACTNLAAGRLWDDGADLKRSAEAHSPLGDHQAEELEPRDELVAIYTRFNPRKVAQVDKLLAHWAGKPGGVPAMMDKVREKYLTQRVLPDPSAAPQTALFRSAISVEPSEPEPDPPFEVTFDGMIGMRVLDGKLRTNPCRQTSANPCVLTWHVTAGAQVGTLAA